MQLLDYFFKNFDMQRSNLRINFTQFKNYVYIQGLSDMGKPQF